MVIVEESGAMGQIVHQMSMRRIQFMEEVRKDQGRKRPIVSANWVRGVSDSVPVASEKKGYHKRIHLGTSGREQWGKKDEERSLRYFGRQVEPRRRMRSIYSANWVRGVSDSAPVGIIKGIP